MTQINIDGNIYIQGLTLPNNPGIGTINCVISGLSGDTPYEFIVVAINENGYSGYAGPILVNTLSEFETQEQYIGRPPIVAWGGLPYGVFFGNPYAYTSGSTSNYVISSTDLSHPAWSKGTLTTGHTAPDGSTSAWAISNGGLIQQILNLPLGHTYIYSYYLNVSLGVTGGGHRMGGNIYPSNPVLSRQIMPYEAPTAGVLPYVVYPNDGITGWRRFAHEIYIGDYGYASNRNLVTLNLLYLDNPTGRTYYYWGPQIEKIS